MNAVKMNVVKNAAAGAMVGGSLLFTAGLVVAHAQPEEESPVTSDGMVSVLVGGATAQDSVPLEEAAAAVTEVCGGEPASVAGEDVAAVVPSLPSSAEHLSVNVFSDAAKSASDGSPSALATHVPDHVSPSIAPRQ